VRWQACAFDARGAHLLFLHIFCAQRAVALALFFSTYLNTAYLSPAMFTARHTTCTAAFAL